jgi:hypothetical protein
VREHLNGALIAALAAVLATSAGAGDVAPRGRALAPPPGPGPPAGPPASAAAWPRFALFGWVSPPLPETSPARYAELAGAGFNATVLAWEDSGGVADNLARLECARPVGVRSLIFDARLDHILPTEPSTFALADTIVARYRGDPAFLGWYLGDEPPPEEFERLGEIATMLRARDPAHPVWNSLLPRFAFGTDQEFLNYLRSYVASLHPSALCNNEYEFLLSGDRALLASNIACLSLVARENALPFWGIVQLTQHGGYRAVTEGMLRWQYAQWLAWGARGIGVFTYWTPGPSPGSDWHSAMIEWGTGARTAYYAIVRDLNAHAAPVGNTLAGAQWLGTQYAGSVPPGGQAFAGGALLDSVAGRATLGFFADSLARPLLLVGNADSLVARTVTLWPAGGRSAVRVGDDGAWSPLEPSVEGGLELDLAAGDFALVRLSGRVDSLLSGHAPRLAAGPNPARDVVRFVISNTDGSSRLEVLDLGGRRVWSRQMPTALGERQLEWTGERDGGGSARAGVYFARLEDTRGVVVRRLAWLGRQ